MFLKNSKQYKQSQNGEENYKSASFLTFKIGDELFASTVIKIITNYKLDKINLVSNITPGLFKGVININAESIPVIDIGLKLGMRAFVITQNTRILLLNTKIGKENCLLAVLVDSLQEVIEIEREKTILIKNIYVINKLTGSAIRLLEIKKLLSANELFSLLMFKKISAREKII